MFCQNDEVLQLNCENTPQNETEFPQISKANTLEIYTVIQTKTFDFELPQYNKKIPVLNIGFGNNGGKPIYITYLTEKGEYADLCIKLKNNETDSYATGHVTNNALYPCVGLVNRFGIRIESDSNIEVDSISISYMQAGIAK